MSSVVDSMPDASRLYIGEGVTIKGEISVPDTLVVCGSVEGDVIVCPRHGARFDIRSGKALTLPAFIDTPWYPTRVVDGMIEPSEAPGIGVELNETEMAKHPYGPDNFLRLFEDGWETRKR